MILMYILHLLLWMNELGVDKHGDGKMEFESKWHWHFNDLIKKEQFGWFSIKENLFNSIVELSTQKQKAYFKKII